MKNLLKNQEVRICNHKDGSSFNWDDPSEDIHIDKIKYVKGGRKEYHIRIPINSNRPMSFSSNNGRNSIPRKLEKEINEAFDDPEKREGFLNYVIESIKNIDSKEFTFEERCNNAIDNLKKAFNIPDDTFIIIKGRINNAVKLVSQIVSDGKDSYYFIVLDNKFVIGEITYKQIISILDEINSFYNNKIRYEIYQLNINRKIII